MTTDPTAEDVRDYLTLLGLLRRAELAGVPSRVPAADWWRLLRVLPARQRRAVLRVTLGGELQRELAADFGVTPGAVQMGLAAALRRLRGPALTRLLT